MLSLRGAGVTVSVRADDADCVPGARTEAV